MRYSLKWLLKSWRHVCTGDLPEKKARGLDSVWCSMWGNTVNLESDRNCWNCLDVFSASRFFNHGKSNVKGHGEFSLSFVGLSPVDQVDVHDGIVILGVLKEL